MDYKTNQDVYRGNNSADYQPPTNNPQSVGTTENSSTLQPTGVGTEGPLSQQSLNNSSSLKVMIVQNGSPSSSLTPIQTATQTWVGPFWGCVALLLIGFIVWAVRQLAKEETPELSKVIEEAIHEPILPVTPAVTPVSSSKTTPVKKTVKKKSKKRSKKTRK